MNQVKYFFPSLLLRFVYNFSKMKHFLDSIEIENGNGVSDYDSDQFGKH